MRLSRSTRNGIEPSNDMAILPVFYEFLADVAVAYPDFALDLLANESNRLSAFLIPILRGVWDSDRQGGLLPLMRKWIDDASSDAKSPLYASAKLFLSTKSVSLDLLERILAKAMQLRDAYVMRQVASVGIVRSSDGFQPDQLKNLFLQALMRGTPPAPWSNEDVPDDLEGVIGRTHASFIARRRPQKGTCTSRSSVAVSPAR